MLQPSQVLVSRKKGLLTIEWNDGEVSEYPMAGLRAACPCAQCRGGHDQMGEPGSPEMLEIPVISSKAVELVELETVGNYALQLAWADGHRYGIYTWKFLRELAGLSPAEG